MAPPPRFVGGECVLRTDTDRTVATEVVVAHQERHTDEDCSHQVLPRDNRDHLAPCGDLVDSKLDTAVTGVNGGFQPVAAQGDEGRPPGAAPPGSVARSCRPPRYRGGRHDRATEPGGAAPGGRPSSPCAATGWNPPLTPVTAVSSFESTRSPQGAR